MKEVTRTLLEFVVVGVAGLVLGLSVNAINPDGLILSRDYFEKPKNAVANGGSDGGVENDPRGGSSTNEIPTEDSLFDYLRELGLQPITHEETVALFQDPFYDDGVSIIIDARNDALYTASHIPGAYQLDHYRMERYIDAVLQACAGAEKIVVYCGGGKCEDSEFAAFDLFDHGVDPSCVYVYAGGFEEWADNNMPIETGTRNSGNITGGGGHE